MIIVGEAKLHCSKGISWYEEGLLKLTDKYSQSDSSIQFAMLVYYFRERNFFDVLADWRTQVEQRKLAYFLSFQSMSDLGLEDNSQAFVTVHNSHGRNLSIVHLWVRLFSDTDVAVKKHSRGKAKKDTAVAVKKPSRRKAKK